MNYLRFFLLPAIVLFVSGCANTGSPGGGPKDETPPRLIKSNPLLNQTNYNKNTVEIFFDELIALDNPSSKVIVSPPQKNIPIVKTINNRIVVDFLDTLRENTTYTIDFTDAIVDYNEKNKFGDYAFSFSTGETIDSMRVGGYLLDASNLNPVPGIFVGVHDNLNDTAFTRIGFRNISKTNFDGYFSVKGIPVDSFRVYALEDKNRDYLFDQPGEAIAFYDSIVIPWSEPCLKTDTIWKDSITVDSLWTRTVTCYRPDDIVMIYFKEDFGRQYLSKRERPVRNKINLNFGYKSEILPEIRLINNEKVKDWYVLESNKTRDSLTYWIKDTSVIQMDSLKLEIKYLKTDSLNNLVNTTDTLELISRKVVKKEKPKNENKDKDEDKKEEKLIPPPDPLDLEVSINGKMDIYSRPTIVFEAPVKEISGNPWHLYRDKDSTWIKVPFTVDKDSLNLRNYILNAKFEFDTKYKFEIDSAMITDIYGKTNLKYTGTFTIFGEEDYSRLILKVNGLNGGGFIEVLDKSDNPVRKEKVIDGIADCKYLKPGVYFVRAVEDLNGNNVWDTGKYSEKKQPERVFYRQKSVELRANWDVEEDWDVRSVSIEKQKPKELRATKR